MASWLIIGFEGVLVAGSIYAFRKTLKHLTEKEKRYRPLSSAEELALKWLPIKDFWFGVYTEDGKRHAKAHLLYFGLFVLCVVGFLATAFFSGQLH